MSFFQSFIASIFFTYFLTFSLAQSQPTNSSFISAKISEKGLNFIKNLLIEQELKALVPLKLPDIKKDTNIPIVGGVVHVTLEDITLNCANASSSTIHVGNTGVVIVASGAIASLSMDWQYSYSTWLFDFFDEGNAFVQVEDMEVGLTITMKGQNGKLNLVVLECGCYMNDLSISLEGGASWFYQWFIDAFKDQIRSSVEDAITTKVMEGISKLDFLLQTLPKQINVDNDVALNVTFVNDPVFEDSSIKFDINGLFIPSDKLDPPSHINENPHSSVSCFGVSKMLEMSLDETVFNSASLVYFQAGLLHWLVDKVPDQSLLNTATYKFIVPQLYGKYPNNDMELNITLTSPPVISITPHVGATIEADMTINVLDESDNIPVACITMAVDFSGVVEISGNNLSGKVGLNNFTLSLKWSEVGNFHMHLILGVVRIFINTVFIPIVNSHLRHGFPLPIIHGFTLQDACIDTANSKMVVCSDVVYASSHT